MIKRNVLCKILLFFIVFAIGFISFENFNIQEVCAEEEIVLDEWDFYDSYGTKPGTTSRLNIKLIRKGDEFFLNLDAYGPDRIYYGQDAVEDSVYYTENINRARKPSYRNSHVIFIGGDGTTSTPLITGTDSNSRNNLGSKIDLTHYKDQKFIEIIQQKSTNNGLFMVNYDDLNTRYDGGSYASNLHSYGKELIANRLTIYKSDIPLKYAGDTTAPTLTITGNPTTWTNNNVTLTVTATDDLSGVKRIQKPDGTWVNGNSTTYAVSSNGTYTFKAEDNAGNVGTKSITISNIDKTPPTKPTINTSTTNWTNENVTFTITHGTDIESGVQKSQYKINTGNWQDYSSAVTVSDEGTHTIYARTIDKAGNISQEATVKINIDKTKPTISSIPDKREKWETSVININVSVKDALSGIKTRKYELNKSPTPTNLWSTANNNNFTVDVNSEGEWYLHVNVIDKAGNQELLSFGPYRFFSLTAPSGIAIVNTTTSTLDIIWNTVESHEYQVQIKNDNGDIINNSGWEAKTSYTFSNLKPNTRYIPEVKAKKHNKETSFVSGIGQYTDANPVKSASFEPMDKAIKIVLDIDSTGNPEGTKYIIKNMDTDETSGEVEKTWTNTGLLNDVDYKYMAKVVHKNGKEGEWFLIGSGHTAITEIILPPEWEDPTGGKPPIKMPDDFNPDTIEGEVIDFNGTLAIVVKGRYIKININNVKNAKQYAVSLDGFGYSDWKDLDATGSLSESIFINTPGLYKVHVKFKNNYGGESKAYVRHFLVDWIVPQIDTTPKIKGQTATTDGTFAVFARGEDNLSPVLYNAGAGWQWYREGDKITYDQIPLDNTRKDVKFKFSDYNGNVVEKIHKIWAINN